MSPEPSPAPASKPAPTTKKTGAPKAKGAVRAKSGCYTCRIRRKVGFILHFLHLGRPLTLLSSFFISFLLVVAFE